ncbi:MAG: FHA domain-containing protein [Gammaproteobacteria bacterium]|nr:FHA domain-containing protein [Gammaproteobacteria bacterium]
MTISDKLFFRMTTQYQLLGLLLLLCFTAHAETVLQNNTMVHYSKVSSDRLALDVRPVDATPIDRVSAHIGEVELNVSRTEELPASQQRTAILFLVDTSDPGRQQAIENTISHLDQLLGFQQDHYLYGLARFDTDLHFLTPLGASAETIRQKARSLQAVGKTTELYRNTLGAIKQLSRYPADRKFLFLLSDGRAEDQAYFHRDVVRAAINNSISVYTIGYADTVSLTVALQTLRRLSEDTGGQYLSTQPGTYQLDNNSLQRMFDAINRGAQFHIDLSPAIQANIGGRQDATLSITSGASHNIINLPVRLPPAKAAQAIVPVTEDITPVAPQIIIERVPKKNVGQTADIYWLLLLAISLLLLGITIYLVVRLGRRLPKLNQPEVVEATDDAYAWLEIADDQGNNPRRYPIRSAETKIGRYRGNDVALHDSAISRYHAEIHFTDDGRFVITDMGSKNGLLVNDQEVLEQHLENNDIIEIGDIRLRFVKPENLADDLQDTQMFRTQLPGRKSHG